MPPLRPTVNAAPAAKPSEAAIRANFYKVILAFTRPRVITRGRPEYIGRTLGAVYAQGARPKALAVCVNWQASTPQQLAFHPSSGWQFVTGTGSCNPTTPIEAAQCALRDCQRHVTACGQGQSCAVVDINDGNALQLPAAWARRHGLRP